MAILLFERPTFVEFRPLYGHPLPTRVTKQGCHRLPRETFLALNTQLVTAYNAPDHVKMSSNRGILIVLEGLDRSGKSTQCQRLVENLRQKGETVEHMRFPNRSTTTGQMIASYLTGQSQQDDHAIHLLFSANRWESARAIEGHIKAGTTVVIDRYYYSGCVYSAAKQNPTMDLAWCRHPEVGLPRPDIALFLDTSAEAVARRGGFGNERYEKKELQDRVRDLYEQMRRHEDESHDIVTINAGQDIEQVENDILEVVKQATISVHEQGRALRHIQPW